MKITDEAKTTLEEAFASNNSDCLKAMVQQSCCGSALAFSLGKLEEGDEPTTINGIPILMDDAAKEKAETITIAVQNGELVIQDEASQCSC